MPGSGFKNFFRVCFSVFRRMIAGYLTRENGEKDWKKTQNELIVFFIGKFKQTLNTQNFFLKLSRPGLTKKTKACRIFSTGFVRMKGLEPPRLSPLDPKSSAATNYATSAFCFAKVIEVYEFANIIRFFSSFTSRHNPFLRTFYDRIPIWSICHIHKNIGSNPKFSVFFINIINGRSGKTHRPAVRQFRR